MRWQTWLGAAAIVVAGCAAEPVPTCSMDFGPATCRSGAPACGAPAVRVESDGRSCRHASTEPEPMCNLDRRAQCGGFGEPWCRELGTTISDGDCADYASECGALLPDGCLVELDADGRPTGAIYPL